MPDTAGHYAARRDATKHNTAAKQKAAGHDATEQDAAGHDAAKHNTPRQDAPSQKLLGTTPPGILIQHLVDQATSLAFFVHHRLC